MHPPEAVEDSPLEKSSILGILSTPHFGSSLLLLTHFNFYYFRQSEKGFGQQPVEL